MTSPFLRVPAVTDRRLVLALDGVRYATKSAELSYSRLLESLRLLRTITNDHDALRAAIVAATTDAWAIIDAVNRLRSFVGIVPRVKQKVEHIRAFNGATKPVKELRNYVQHMSNELPRLASAGSPLWGSLSWRTTDGPLEDQQNVHAIIAGTFYPDSHVTLTPVGPPCSAEIGAVTLSAGGQGVDLTTTIEACERLYRYLESIFEWPPGELHVCNSDIMVTANPRLPGLVGDQTRIVLRATAG